MAGKCDGRSAVERFWVNVDKTGDCWLWTGYIKPNGYATFYPGGGRHVDKIYVHRFAYELTRGHIPDGLEIDHLCNVRHCVNPAHLDVVTRRVNLERRDAALLECRRGHAFTDENTYRAPGNPSHRHCRACQLINRRKRQERLSIVRGV